MFNQNEEIFYLFEPLVLFPDSSKYASYRARTINDVFNCTIPDPKDIYETVWCPDSKCSEWLAASNERQNILNICMTQKVCFRGHSDTFKQKPYCNNRSMNKENHNDQFFMDLCGAVNLVTSLQNIVQCFFFVRRKIVT